VTTKDHWESVYRSKGEQEVSWTQAEPAISLSLIREVCPSGGSVIDVGGGISVLTGRLLDAGYTVGVLDISAAAIDRARQRLGQRGGQVRWIVSDVTATPPLGDYDVWHDRAVFHFHTSRSGRAAYVALLSRTVPVGGHAIIATFALNGPEKCSGLPVQRYDAATLARELGAGFNLVKSLPEIHQTPWGKQQSFQYSLFRRTNA
jgi:2-polyprenyl-3-methyl-5-hydroxy-6-metoxy-1,4-benzoquinol methylase